MIFQLSILFAALQGSSVETTSGACFECEYLALDQCNSNSNCFWDGEECETIEAEGYDAGATEQPDNLETICGLNLEESSCASPCIWNLSEGGCVPDENEPLEPEENTCEKNTQDACVSPCVWSVYEVECISTVPEYETPDGMEPTEAFDEFEPTEEPEGDNQCEIQTQTTCADPCAWSVAEEQCVSTIPEYESETEIETELYSSNCASFTDSASCGAEYHCAWVTNTCYSREQIDLQMISANPHSKTEETSILSSGYFQFAIFACSCLLGLGIGFRCVTHKSSPPQEDILLEDTDADASVIIPRISAV